jgi:hypothetical protein
MSSTAPLGAAHQVEPEVAGVNVPVAVDDHVVEVPAGVRREVRVHRDGADVPRAGLP